MFQHRQIHVWITESDYRLLREEAQVTRDSVSGVIRRLIKAERLRHRPLVLPRLVDPAFLETKKSYPA